ncbi:MAG: putative glycolipid-binding domain-containing protein [Ktedonobacterales bacterium]
MIDQDRSVVWRPVSGRGSDQCSLWRDARGWRLEGIVVTDAGGTPAQVRYAVECAPDWSTWVATCELRTASALRYLELRVRNGRWYLGGREVEALRGCVDVDFGFTPATNTLPVRRLRLAPGASAEVVAAWVRFPELSVQPLTQRYTRLDTDHYRYESDSGFTADLTVDDVGLVVDYPGGWERVR